MIAHNQKATVALLSVASNTVLVLLKLIVGTLIGSVSVVSEAIHSGVDLLAAAIAYIAVRRSAHPLDREHPYGHGKVENVSGTIEATLIFLAAGWIVWEAVRRLLHPAPLEAVGWGVGVMLLSAVANLLVSQALFRVGRATDSIALQADAWHLRTDVWASAGVTVGLAGVWVGGRLWPGADLRWIDPVAAMGVALLIVKAAYHLTVESARDLLDAQLPPDEVAWIQSCLSHLAPEVRGYHCLRTRKSGAERFVDVHLLVDPQTTVEAAHRLTKAITQTLCERFPGMSVLIHIEPDGEAACCACAQNCPLPRQDPRAGRFRGPDAA